MPKNPKKTEAEQLKELLTDPEWRINNLYWIIDEHGKRVKFRLKWAQKVMFRHMWFFNIVLKARQVRSTTFWCVFALDTALFNPNLKMGIIAHTELKAIDILNDKIRYPYENLPEWLKVERPLGADSTTRMAFKFPKTEKREKEQFSEINVGVGLRSGTYQFVLVTEHGPLCAQYPEKAQEFKTGTLPTIHAGQMLVIESTASGRGGDFYRFCTDARNKALQKQELSKIDLKFFFFPWWMQPEYRLEVKNLVIPSELQAYFAEIEGKPISPELEQYYGKIVLKLDDQQKAWYVKTYERLEDDMKQEHPSTPDEAFEASIVGAYYQKQMSKVRLENRLADIPYDPFSLVYTGWDLGMHDYQVIWFYQVIGFWVHFIDYYENNNLGMDHYAEILREKGYGYGNHFAPHDISKRDPLDGRELLNRTPEVGITFTKIDRTKSLQNDVQEMRRFLGRCRFDAGRCSIGIEHLDNFRKTWDKNNAYFINTPARGVQNHGEAGLRTVMRAVLEHPHEGTVEANPPMTPERANQLRMAHGPPGVRVANQATALW